MSLLGINVKGLSVLITVLLVAFSCGCLSFSFGDVVYNTSGKTLDMEITNNGDQQDVTLQATVFDLSGFRQVEQGVYINGVTLEPGDNYYQIPVELGEGSYKVYLYVLEDGKRGAAVIRNFEVA